MTAAVPAWGLHCGLGRCFPWGSALLPEVGQLRRDPGLHVCTPSWSPASPPDSPSPAVDPDQGSTPAPFNPDTAPTREGAEPPPLTGFGSRLETARRHFWPCFPQTLVWALSIPGNSTSAQIKGERAASIRTSTPLHTARAQPTASSSGRQGLPQESRVLEV